MVFYRTPWTRLMAFHGTASVLQGTQWHSMELHDIPWNFMAFHGTPSLLHGTPWNSMAFHGTPWILHGTPWHSMELHGYSMEVPWNSMDFHLFPWNSMDFHRFPWISMEFHGGISLEKRRSKSLKLKIRQPVSVFGKQTSNCINFTHDYTCQNFTPAPI